MQIITLGIGTPADIPHFILFGLSPAPHPDLTVADASIHVRPTRSTVRELAGRQTTRVMARRHTTQEAEP